VGKVKIRITLTRYQKERLLGKQYRADDFKGSFTDYIKKKKKESK
jgi:hypothetical protein